MHTVMQEMLGILQRSTIVTHDGVDKRVRFWNKYNTVAEEHDNEFLAKYNGAMDTSMIFVSF